MNYERKYIFKTHWVTNKVVDIIYFTCFLLCSILYWLFYAELTENYSRRGFIF